LTGNREPVESAPDSARSPAAFVRRCPRTWL